MDRASEQVTDAATERLALEVPHGDVDRGDGVRGDPAAVAVPPRPVLESSPDCVGVHRVGADDELVEAVDERGHGGVGLGELGDRLAPADLTVVGGQLDEAQVPGGVEVVGLGIGDRDRFHLDDTHRGHLRPIGTLSQTIPVLFPVSDASVKLRCVGEGDRMDWSVGHGLRDTRRRRHRCRARDRACRRRGDGRRRARRSRRRRRPPRRGRDRRARRRRWTTRAASATSPTSPPTTMSSPRSSPWPVASITSPICAAVLRRRADIDEVTEDDWDFQVDVNLKASFFLMRTGRSRTRGERRRRQHHRVHVAGLDDRWVRRLCRVRGDQGRHRVDDVVAWRGRTPASEVRVNTVSPGGVDDSDDGRRPHRRGVGIVRRRHPARAAGAARRARRQRSCSWHRTMPATSPGRRSTSAVAS